MFGPIIAWIRKQLGQRTDTASATGSLHAKIEYLFDKNIIANDSVIKSIQRGVATCAEGSTSGTITITSVNTAKAFVLVSYTNATFSAPNTVKLVLTNATTLTWYKTMDADFSDAVDIAWQVVEFY